MGLIVRGTLHSPGKRRNWVAGAALVCALAFVPAGAAEAKKCTQTGTSGVDLLKGTKKKDVLCGKGGDDVLLGKGGNDVLKAGAGNDILTGKSGNDTLAGGAGDDSLGGGTGDDNFKGAAGLDVAAFADAPASVTIDLAAGSASGDGNDTLNTVENVIGSPLADTLTGDAAANDLSAGDGDDKLVGGGGDDQFRGQGGTDVVSYAGATGPLSVDLAVGTASGEGSDSLSGIENLIGTSQGDTLGGDPAANVLDGAAGNDTASYASSATAVVADLSAGSATGNGADSLPGIENLTGSPQADSLSGDGAANKLAGGEGDDALAGGAGNDELLGQGGNDTAKYSTSSDPVNADLTTGAATGQGNDSLAGIESLIGSAQNDTFVGDPAANALDGGAGTDTVSFAAATSPVNANLLSGTASGAGTDNLTAVENLIGSAHDDTLVGDGSVNSLRAGDGNDALSSGDGNDQLAGENGNDSIYGESDDDDLTGGPGDDLLDGGTGVNACDGGSGNNSYAGNCDSSAPVLADLDISPASVNTNLAARTVTFTVDVTDNLSGLDPVNSTITVYNPAAEVRFTEPLTPVAGGSPQNGSYTAAVTLPRYSVQGTWTIDLRLIDQSTNADTLTSAELIAGGFPGGFEQSGAGDSAVPVLTDFTLAPASVDTFTAPRTINFALDATDDLAGVDPATSAVLVYGPGGVLRDQSPLTLASGGPLNGSYTAAVTLPRYSAQGTWTVAVVLADGALNATTITRAQLEAAGFPASFVQSGAGDTTAPQLGGFTRTPDVINTTAGDEVINFTAVATDDLAGIDASGSKVVVYDPNDVRRFEAVLVKVPATASNYTAQVTIPQGSATGIWKLQVELIDLAGNETVVTSEQLIAAGFPGTFNNNADSGT